MIKSIRLGLIVIFIGMTVWLLAWFKLTQPRILILQSYNTDYAWTRDVDIGLKRVLDSNPGYKVQWHYMDTKKHPDVAFQKRAGILAMHEIESYRPDLIIAIDDAAHKYALKNYVNQPGYKILFAGINGSIEQYGYDKAINVTGIYEQLPLNSLRKALLEIRDREGNPLGARITQIGDQSGGVKDDSVTVTAADWTPFKLVDTKLVSTFDEWQAAVNHASANSDIILMSNCKNILRNQGEKDFVPTKEIAQWTEEHSRIPVVGLNGFWVEDGGMLAITTSGFEQGDAVARMAHKILDQGIAAKDIPHVVPRQYLVYMRQSQFEKRKLTLPDIYEAFARASNNYY